jgi:putative addiction module antidote
MIKKVKARKMGGSIGATLPKEMVERLHIEEGDELTIVETEDGLLVTPYDPTFEEAMAAYERGAKKYRNALKKLAE